MKTIKEILTKGIELRERGNYIEGEKLLFEAYEKSKEHNDSRLVLECGNQLSIQYRLIAGRYAREDNMSQAKKYSLMSLNLFSDLASDGIADSRDPATQRNYSHALLYSGFIDQATNELQKSADCQKSEALRGDELCHLASAYLDEENLDLERALKLVDLGINLIETNNGSVIAQTYGYMVRASVLLLSGFRDKSKEDLKKALQIAKENKLIVRQEEINFILFNFDSNLMVLDAISGTLRDERRHLVYR